MQVLKRRKYSGFVEWPRGIAPRMLSGTATFQTKCDLLVGPCSCGIIHREIDSDTKEILNDYQLEIEPLVLGVKNGEVRIPKYWGPIHCTGSRRCTHLIGKCSCGDIHKVNTSLMEILKRYRAKISFNKN